MEIVKLLEKKVDRKYLEPFFEGHLAIPEPLPVNNPYLVQEGGYVYLKKTYQQETKILNELRRIIQNSVNPFKAPMEQLPLLEVQKRAVSMAAAHPLLLLTGGPGTGKTYTAGFIIKTLLEQKGLSFVLSAPTGKACAQLKKSIQSSCEGLDLPSHRVMTLHALLEPYKENALSVIPEDLVVVDEASMIDLDLLGLLLSKIRHGSRLILIGDPNQLPPVETPSLFPDMVELCGKLGLHVDLQECLRVEDRQIIEYGQDLLEGIVSFPVQPLDSLRLDRKIEVILTPLKKGPHGVDHLNEALFQRELLLERCTVPIIVTKNDFQQKLFNGETGVIEFSRSDWRGSLRSTRGVAKFITEGKEVVFPIYELPPFDLAFAISVHKSQGSAYNHPILLLPKGSSHFGRELIYTAFTRAKKGITVFGDRSELEAILKVSSRRQSALFPRYLNAWLSEVEDKRHDK